MQAATTQNNNYGGLFTATKKNIKDNQPKIIFEQWRKYAEEQLGTFDDANNIETLNTKPESTQSKLKKKREKIVNHTVDPLIDEEDINALYDYFFNHKVERPQHQKQNQGKRNFCMCVLGMAFGLRIGDLLSLTISDVVENGKVVDSFWIEEEKTRNKQEGSIRQITLSKSVKNAIVMYLNHRAEIKSYEEDDFLFESNKRNGKNNPHGVSQPITRQTAWYILDKAEKELGFDKKGIKLGTHTLRKTTGALAYRQNPDDPLIMQHISQNIYGHSSERITRRYIGLTDKRTKEIYMDLEVGNVDSFLVGSEV